MLDLLYKLQDIKKEKSKLNSALYVISCKLINLLIYTKYKLFYKCIKKKGVNNNNFHHEIIVSLTTFKQRIEQVGICIETIMNQSTKPDRIILWIAEGEFNNIYELPEHLQYLCKRGLEIKFCDDLRSHKKYYYSMKENPNAVIITIDDDVYYPKNTIKRLIDSYKKYPTLISCNKAKYINITSEGIEPYNTWENITSKEEKGINIIPIGVGGVLYPPASLHNNVFNVNDIKSLCFHTDDLWLKAMSLMNNTEVVYIGKFPTLCTVKDSQRVHLGAINCTMNRNDLELSNIMKVHKNSFAKLTQNELR